MAALALVLGTVFAAAPAQAAPSANALAGNGYSSSYAGESVFRSLGPGETGQFSVIFNNDGTQAWAPGVVGLLVCLPDKVTCNVPSPNDAYRSSWYSTTVYATVTATVAPGQNGFFIYSIKVPANAASGVVTTFNGDVGLIATGALLRPQGYFHRNATPLTFGTLSVSPATASVPVNGQQQFNVDATYPGTTAWSVTGGCGAIGATGLFVGTVANSTTQPCTVTASLGGLTASASVVVHGPAASLSCVTDRTTLISNGGDSRGGTATVTVTVKDLNGNTATGNAPVVTITNFSSTTATVTPAGSVTPVNGVVSLAVASTYTPGTIVIGASAALVTGCSVLIASNASGNATRAVASFADDVIAADGTSSSVLRVDLLDAMGDRTTDSATSIEVTRGAGSGAVCSLAGVLAGSSGSATGGSAVATAVNGRVEFLVRATTTPGTCTVTVTPRNTVVSVGTATLITKTVGLPTKLGIRSNDSPHAAGSSSQTTITVDIQDAAGTRVTSAGATIAAALDPATCAGAGGGNAYVSSSGPTSAGRAGFSVISYGAYPACLVTFSASGLTSATATIVFTPGGPDHLSCTVTPVTIRNDGTTASVRVAVTDRLGNVILTGSYPVGLQRSNTPAYTSVLTSGTLNTASGIATFTVRASGGTGADTYTPTLISGGLTNAVANSSCVIAVVP